jgi:hypothetical protein
MNPTHINIFEPGPSFGPPFPALVLIHLTSMKSALVFAVVAASAEAALGFAPVAPAAPRSGVLALRAQVFLFPLLLGAALSRGRRPHLTGRTETRRSRR